MLENVDACIFDLDGTLVDSMWVWVSVDEEYIRKYKLTKPKDFHAGMEGMSYSETAQYFLDCFPSIPLSREEIMDEWTQMAHEKYMTEVLLKKGAKEFLQDLKERGIKTGIASSNSKQMIVDTLKSHGIAEYIDSVRSACEAGAGKPSPDVYLLVAKDLNAEPKRCLIFEDVPMGILAGKNAGMKTCAVDDDFSKGQEEKKRTLADYYIQDYDDIKNGTYEVLSE
ncbi:MAG: HAD family phosphatase [Dorea sp.]|nr:HAD family phosphatase [Dorea sp.]